MTNALLLSRCPQRVNLLRNETLSAVRVSRTLQRLSCISTHPNSRIHTIQRQTNVLLHLHPQQPLTLKGIRQISSPRWNSSSNRNLATTSNRSKASSSSTSEEGKTFSSSSSSTSNRNNKRGVGIWFWVPGSVVFLWVMGSVCFDEDHIYREALLEFFVGRALNRHTFVPFLIVEREQVSPTSFVITVRPKYARDPEVERPSWWPGFLRKVHSSQEVLETAWEYGLWSVEVKQPMLQVAREYTPLPSMYGEEEEDLRSGRLRFLIRKVEGGEVSGYLAGLGVGDVVELRGPHLGFDVRGRLGVSELTKDGDVDGEDENKKQQKVVFLAGGTGIAPALQVVRAVLDGDSNSRSGPEVNIVWANRHRADCEGCEGVETILKPGFVEKLKQGGAGVSGKNAVLDFLAEARARHGDKLKYACTVDEKGEFINARTIEGVTGMSPHTSPSTSGGLSSSFWKRGEGTTATSSEPARQDTEESDSRLDCAYHSSKRLITTDGSEDIFLSQPQYPNILQRPKNQASCQCYASQRGTNLLMVSGPDGFISTFVGPKVWANSKELQGPVRGVVGNELSKKDERFWRDWLVLKM